LSQQLLQALPTTPKAPQLSSPPAVTSTEGGDKAPAAMAELMTALTQQRDALPPQVQALLESHFAADLKTTEKSLHRLVKQQGQARQELSNLRRARAQYMVEWNGYLAGLKDLLAKQLDIKNNSMREYAEAEEKWTSQLVAATQALQQASGGGPSNDTVDLTDEHIDAMDAEVAEDAERESARSMAVERATDKEQALVAALELAQQAAKDQAEQYRERTPRRSRPAAGEVPSATADEAAGPMPPRMVPHTIADDRSFTGEFWGPLLGLCAQADVALQEFLPDGATSPFDNVDRRLLMGSSLWDTLAQESVEATSDLCPLAFQLSGAYHGRRGTDAADEARGRDAGVASRFSSSADEAESERAVGSWHQQVLQALQDCASVVATCSWECLSADPSLAGQWASSFARKCRGRARRRQEEHLLRWTNLAAARTAGAYFFHFKGSCHTGPEHKCPDCALQCKTAAALAAHMSKAHGRVATSTAVANGTRCEVCSTEFWSTKRLRDHLRRQPKCLKVWAESDLDSREVAETSRRHAWRPACKTSGPAPWWATLRPESAPSTATDASFDGLRFITAWLQSATNGLTETQVHQLIAHGIAYHLTPDDMPVAVIPTSASAHGIARCALFAAQAILARSAGSEAVLGYKVHVQGDRASIWPNE
ncbi:unnamed protein product, partial [Symbiodinium sp. CCMP2456]